MLYDGNCAIQDHTYDGNCTIQDHNTSPTNSITSHNVTSWYVAMHFVNQWIKL